MHPPASTHLPASTGPAAGTRTAGRLAWADAGKGVCIVLVVLHHLVTKHYDLVLTGDGFAESFWLAVTETLKPVRMPLFFVISGMFAAGAVHRPWRDVTRRRVATPYYLYAVWLLVHAVVFSAATALPMNRTRSVGELAGDLVLASTQLWYLYALAVYFVLAKLLRPLDARWVLAGAAGVSAMTSLLPIEAANRESVLQHFVYFLAGVLLPHLPRRIADLRDRRLTPALAVGFVVTAAAAGILGLPQSTTTLLGAVTGVPLAIRLVVAASRRTWFDRPAAALGRQTLPVYVLHIPLLSLLHVAVVRVLPEAPQGAAWVLPVAVYPVVATAAVTAACLLVHAILTRSGLGSFFRLPTALSGYPGRSKK